MQSESTNYIKTFDHLDVDRTQNALTVVLFDCWSVLPALSLAARIIPINLHVRMHLSTSNSVLKLRAVLHLDMTAGLSPTLLEQK